MFSFVIQRKKLELIKYNKNLQNKIDISLLYYKAFSKKYIIYESNRKGKEYNGLNDVLIYEGEYLNGKRNGKGKEYHFLRGYLLFEGEYLNGKRNGKGKAYNENGKLLFEGEHLKGKRDGKGKIYNEKGELIKIAEYKEDKLHGKLKSFKEGKLSIELEFIDGILLKAKYYDKKGNIIKEEYEKGKEFYNNGNLKFEGEYLNG